MAYHATDFDVNSSGPRNPKAPGVRPAGGGRGPSPRTRPVGNPPEEAPWSAFLVDSRVALRHVDHAKIGPTDTVLEIGPGLGVLTRLLAGRARHVVAIEADRRFAAYLRESLPRVEVIEGDALTIEWPRFDVIASNLPYQISSPLTFRLLNEPFRRAVLMYQWEFARRMIAKPATADYSRLSVGVYRRSACEILERVPRNAFYPSPAWTRRSSGSNPVPPRFRSRIRTDTMRSWTPSSRTGGRRSRTACASAGRAWRRRGRRLRPSCRPCRSHAARRGVVSRGDWSRRRRRPHGERLMAHPPIAAFHPAPGDPMVRKKTLSELDQAEIKLQSLLEKRDALNQEAALLRQERDLVHETKREIGVKLRGLKDRRASFAGEAESTARNGRAPGEGESPDRDETEAPRLRPRRRRRGAARLETARHLDGDAAADRIPDAECRERAARRTQRLDETPQATRGAQGGSRQDREGDQRHRLGHHRVLRGRGEGA